LRERRQRHGNIYQGVKRYQYSEYPGLIHIRIIYRRQRTAKTLHKPRIVIGN
jgi:hypothetical protein